MSETKEPEKEKERHGIKPALNSLVMRMAKNRTDLGLLKIEIDSLVYDDKFNLKVDLSKYREYWYEGDGNENRRWDCWVSAVNEPCNVDFDNEKPSCDEIVLAEMLDKKAAIRREYRAIKRSLCAMGRKMIKDA